LGLSLDYLGVRFSFSCPPSPPRKPARARPKSSDRPNFPARMRGLFFGDSSNFFLWLVKTISARLLRRSAATVAKSGRKGAKICPFLLRRCDSAKPRYWPMAWGGEF